MVDDCSRVMVSFFPLSTVWCDVGGSKREHWNDPPVSLALLDMLTSSFHASARYITVFHTRKSASGLIILGSRFSSRRTLVGGRGGRRYPRSPKRRTEPIQNQHDKAREITKDAVKMEEPMTKDVGLQQRLKELIIPKRFRDSGSTYTKAQAAAIAQRLPLALLLIFVASWEETSPYSMLRIQGPSMVPTMAPDGSDIWLGSTFVWRRRLGFQPPYKKGDLVGFAHPDHPEHVSCKRIIGVVGDRVPRYGQYAHLYLQQDPDNLGMLWPPEDDDTYSWIDRKSSWDVNYCLRDRKEEARRTLVVPEGCVWVEADCPNFGIDSRHFGPIPVEWLKGRIVARLWPLWRKDKDSTRFLSHNQRPHPIPLDEDTLRFYNVHRIQPRA